MNYKNNLTNNSMEQKLLRTNTSGPVFEAGPGWGTKTKNWFSKYLLKVILPVAVVALLIYGFSTRNRGDHVDDLFNPPSINETSATINQTVLKGDSLTLIARRALADYLSGNPDVFLTTGQKIFIENKLSQSLASQTLKVGAEVEINTTTILNLIDESKQLTKSQLDKWENYARSIRF